MNKAGRGGLAGLVCDGSLWRSHLGMKIRAQEYIFWPSQNRGIYNFWPSRKIAFRGFPQVGERSPSGFVYAMPVQAFSGAMLM